MPRVRPQNRLSDLLVAATKVFAIQGYRRTQMADVAKELGITPNAVHIAKHRVMRRLRDELDGLME